MALFSGLSLLSACSSGYGNPVAGEWAVETYADPFKATLDPTTVEPDESYFLRLDKEGLFMFTTDCNTISGDYSVNGSDLRFENISATEMACEKEIVERSIMSQLPMVRSFTVSGDSVLCLIGGHDNVLVRLVRVDDRE